MIRSFSSWIAFNGDFWIVNSLSEIHSDNYVSVNSNNNKNNQEESIQHSSNSNNNNSTQSTMYDSEYNNNKSNRIYNKWINQLIIMLLYILFDKP